jgi:hypothetical protein
VLGIRPGREVGPALCDQFERQIRPEPVNLSDIAAEQAVQGGANIEGWVIGLLLRCSHGRRFTYRGGRGLPQPFQHSFDAHVAERHFGLVDVVQFQRLGQGKDVLFAIIADERLTDRLRRRMAAWVAIGRQNRRVALTGHNRTDDGLAGDTG